MNNSDTWRQLKEKALTFLLLETHYEYDFLAAPIIAAAVAFGAEFSPLFGECARGIIGNKGTSCLIILAMRAIGVLSLGMGGIFIWRLGHYSRLTHSRIEKQRQDIDESRGRKFNPADIEKRKKDTAARIINEESGYILGFASAAIISILLSLLLINIAGFISGFW